LAERARRPGGAQAKNPYVVGIDVDDRHVEALRQIRRPARRARASGVVVKPIWLLVITWIVPLTAVSIQRLQASRR
jgi:hypothetical protein